MKIIRVTFRRLQVLATRSSVLGWSVGLRMLVVVPVVIGLWLAVCWAVQDIASL